MHADYTFFDAALAAFHASPAGSRGFTFNPRTGRLNPARGFAVSDQKDRETLVDVLDRAALTAFYSANADLLSSGNDGSHWVGAWEYQGKVYLDVTLVCADERKAARIARSADQIAYWSFARQVSIELVKA